MTFSEKIYNLLKKVPKGRVTTYKALASLLNTKAYRAVGSALNRNPHAPQVRCHRVINSNGYVGDYALGKKAKINLLKSEGIEITNNKINLKKYEYNFNASS